MLELISSYVNSYSQAKADTDGQSAITVTANSEHEESGAVSARRVRSLPGQTETTPDGQSRDTLELSREAEEIRKLQVRDQEVRAHEAAHAAAGGAYAGAPSYSFKRGPDGKSYAVGGEVSIDVSAVSGDPQATLQKAQQIRAAALAPAEPSAKDMQVAQRSQAMAAKARQDLSQKMTELLKLGNAANQSEDELITAGEETNNAQPEVNATAGDFSGGMARLSVQA